MPVSLSLQIMGLSPHPHEDFILVGLGNGQQWLQPTSGNLKQMVGCRENTILDLAFSPRGEKLIGGPCGGGVPMAPFSPLLALFSLMP